MTPRQFSAWRKGIAEREQREWERARYTAYLSVLPHVGSKRHLKITDLGRFPWEKVVAPKFDQIDKATHDMLRDKALKMFTQIGVVQNAGS